MRADDALDFGPRVRTAREDLPRLCRRGRELGRELRRGRFDALARSNKVYLDAVGQSVKYGPVSVDGQRVTRGWKAMRVMNSLSIEYIDATVRVMKGTTAWFVFTKVE